MKPLLKNVLCFIDLKVFHFEEICWFKVNICALISNQGFVIRSLMLKSALELINNSLVLWIILHKIECWGLVSHAEDSQSELQLTLSLWLLISGYIRNSFESTIADIKWFWLPTGESFRFILSSPHLTSVIVTFNICH